ncbi:MAG: hypothetical protein RL268_2861, partial [Pseudomonadota bacterium]
TEKMKYIADLNIAGGVLTIVCLFFSVHGPEDYLMVPLIFSAISLIVGRGGSCTPSSYRLIRALALDSSIPIATPSFS